MKKLICIFVLISAMIGGTAFAAPNVFHLYLGTSDSGNTTVASGTSNLVVEGSGMPRSGSYTIIDTRDFTGQWWAVEIVDAFHSTGQVSAGGDVSGVSFTLQAKTWTVSANKDTANAIPVITQETIESSTSPYKRTIKIPWGQYVEFQLLSGVTPLDRFHARVAGNIPDGEVEAVVVGSQVFSLNANSGTSTPASDDYSDGVPTGSQYAELEVISPSGNSLFYTRDLKTLSKATANTLLDGDIRALNRDEIEKLKMEALGACVIRIDHYNKEP